MVRTTWLINRLNTTKLQITIQSGSIINFPKHRRNSLYINFQTQNLIHVDGSICTIVQSDTFRSREIEKTYRLQIKLKQWSCRMVNTRSKGFFNRPNLPAILKPIPLKLILPCFTTKRICCSFTIFE